MTENKAVPEMQCRCAATIWVCRPFALRSSTCMRSEPVNDGPWTYERQSGRYLRVETPRAVVPPAQSTFATGLGQSRSFFSCMLVGAAGLELAAGQSTPRTFPPNRQILPVEVLVV